MKLKMIIATITLLTSLSIAKGFTTINVKQFDRLKANGIAVIDIRTPQEWRQTGIIKGSHRLMFFDAHGNAHAKTWIKSLRKIIKNKNTPFVIYCAHANRSKAVGKWLTNKLSYKNVYELKGGIEYGWIDLGRKTVRVR